MYKLEQNSMMMIMMLVLYILVRSSTSLFLGFGTTFQADSYVATKCTGYIGQHLCVGYNSSGVPTSTIIQYSSFQPNTSYFGNIYGINQLMGATGMVSSYSDPVYFVSGNKNGGVYQVDVMGNSAQLLYQHNYSAYFAVLITEDKGSIPKFYYFLVNSYSTTNFTTEICYKIMPSQTCIPIATLSTQTVAVSVNQYKTIVILHVDNTLNQTTLSLMYPNGTIYSNLTKNMKGSRNFLVTSAHYVGFAINGFIYAFDANTSTQLWTFTVTIPPKNVKQMALVYPWLVTYDDNNKVMQFNIINGMKFDTFSPTSIYQYVTITFNSVSKQYSLCLQIVNDTLMYKSVLSDQYITGNGSCITGYLLNGTSCKPPTPTTILAIFSFIVPPPPLPAPAPAPTPSPTPSSSQNLMNSSLCYDPHIQDASQCHIFCSERCNECLSIRTQCESCSQYYFMLDENQKYCQTEKSIKIISLIYMLFNTFKNTKTLAFYAYLQNFQLYQYHKIRYRGILERVFNFTRFIAEKQWEVIQADVISDKFDTLWFVGSEYIPMTNRDYLLVQRKDLTFIQNTKQFFFLFLPITVLAYVLLNRLSKLLTNLRLGRVFVNFSFWIYLFIILIFNDTERFSYLSFMQLANLSHFRFVSIVFQAISVLVIGLWMILCCSLYMMCTYFHKKKTIDMGNFRCTPSSLFVITFRYALKPIIQASIHYFLWSDTGLQIISLLVIEIVSFFILVYSHVLKKLVKTRLVFAFQCNSDLSAAVINTLIYVKYVYLQKSIETGNNSQLTFQQEIKSTEIIEDCIEAVTYLSGVILGLSLFVGFCQVLRELVLRQRKITDNQNSGENSRKKSQKDKSLNIFEQASIEKIPKKKGIILKAQNIEGIKQKSQKPKILIKVDKVAFRKQVQQFLRKKNYKKSRY